MKKKCEELVTKQNNPVGEEIIVNNDSLVLNLTINRANQKNALNRSVTKTLTSLLLTASNDETVKVVVISGAGGTSFCSGADLRELMECQSADERQEFFGCIARLLSTFVSCKKPIISKVKGHALAGGCGLVAASDIAIASSDAIFGLPEVKIGLAPLMILAPLSRCIGQKALADIVLTGELFGASRAKEMGLISRVSATDTIDDEVDKIAKKIASFSPEALSAAKSSIWNATDMEYTKSLNTFAQDVSVLSSSKEVLGNIERFLAKRSAQ